MLVYSIAVWLFPAKYQIVVSTGIHLLIPSRYVATILKVAHTFPLKLLLCPGIPNTDYSGVYHF